jgi:MFS family permease
VPHFTRVVTGTMLGRLAGQMWTIAIVLFVLARFHSPQLAGLTVFLSIFPGLIFSPVAGALLDRQGRVRLMILDYSLTAVIVALIAGLSLTHRLIPAILLPIATLMSLSNILSITGARSLFPLMVPRPLWDRANGLDSSGYALTSIIGPAVAGAMVAVFSPEGALFGTAAVVAAAAISLVRVPEPVERAAEPGPLAKDAWAALVYVVRHPTLRGLAVSISLSNLGFGTLTVGLPLLVLQRLHEGAATVGQVFAVFGVAGLISALLFGRMNSEGRERAMIAGPMVVEAVALTVLAFAGNLLLVFLSAVLAGLLVGAQDIGLFSLRQRRTDPAWFGRAFAVSMSLNYAGAPVGSAISGPLLARSITLTLLLGAAINVAAAVTTVTMIPRHAEA